MHHFTTTVRLLRESGFADGSRTVSEIAAVPCTIIDLGDTLDSDSGVIASGRELLIAPQAVPYPGDRVIVDGRSGVIRSVRICRDLDGIIRAYRCALVK